MWNSWNSSSFRWICRGEEREMLLHVSFACQYIARRSLTHFYFLRVNRSITSGATTWTSNVNAENIFLIFFSAKIRRTKWLFVFGKHFTMFPCPGETAKGRSLRRRNLPKHDWFNRSTICHLFSLFFPFDLNVLLPCMPSHLQKVVPRSAANRPHSHLRLIFVSLSSCSQHFSYYRSQRIFRTRRTTRCRSDDLLESICYSAVFLANRTFSLIDQ